MKEKTLFTVIALLLVAILGVGAYAAFKNPSAVAEIPSTAVDAVASAVTNVTGTSGSADTDRDGDTGTDTDDDADTTVTTPATGTSGSGTQTTAGTYTMAQVAAHATASSCYTTINGSVYDLTPFINQHPGGPAILQLCGIEGTATFMAQHGGQGKPERELASLKIGTLAK